MTNEFKDFNKNWHFYPKHKFCISSDFSLEDHKMLHYECSGNLIKYCFCLICKKAIKLPFLGCYLDHWHCMNLYYLSFFSFFFFFCELIVTRKSSLFHLVSYCIFGLSFNMVSALREEKLRNSEETDKSKGLQEADSDMIKHQ